MKKQEILITLRKVLKNSKECFEVSISNLHCETHKEAQTLCSQLGAYLSKGMQLTYADQISGLGDVIILDEASL